MDLIKKYHFYFIAGALCLLFTALCYFSIAGFGRPNSPYRGKSITFDEVSHVPAGYYYLNTGKYFLNPEHPPLVKTLAALPLLMLKNNIPTLDKKLEIREDGQWSWGSIFLFQSENQTDLIATLARSSVILFNTIFLFILTLLLAKLVSKKMALIALSLLIFSPLTLAHASLVTMDFMSSILQLITLVAFCLAIKELKNTNTLNWSSIMCFAIALSGALLAKFSSIFLLPALIIGGTLYIFLPKDNNRQRNLLKFITVLAVAFCMSLLVIGMTYVLEMKYMNNEDLATQFTSNWPGHLSPISENILKKMILLGPLARGWAEYINGTLIISSVVEKSKSGVYFLGHNYAHGGAGLLYFPTLYIVKLPLGFHLLTILVVLAIIKYMSKKELRVTFRLIFKKLFTCSPVPVLLISFISIYSVIALRSTLQIGIRHIMPAILAFTLLLAYLINYFWSIRIFKNATLGKATCYIIASLFITALLAFPNYLAYYNIIAGGTDNGYKVAGDSNYDWGQDLKVLKKWRDDNKINFAYVDIFANPFGEINYYLGPVPKKEDYHSDIAPPNSFIAISTNRYTTNIANPDVPSNQKYINLQPYFYKRIGKSILIFKTP